MSSEGWEGFDELASELRRTVGSEFQREAEEVERLVELQRLRRRSLLEAVGEHVARGDKVTVHLGEQRLSGIVTGAVNDLAHLVEGDRQIDVNLGATVLLEVVERARQGGHQSVLGSRTFRARLAEFEQTGELLTLVLSPDGRTLRGRVRVVAPDHALVENEEGRDVYVALGSVGAVIRVIGRAGPDGP